MFEHEISMKALSDLYTKQCCFSFLRYCYSFVQLFFPHLLHSIIYVKDHDYGTKIIEFSQSLARI